VDDADAAGFDTFTLVGHSMGGLTITEVANRWPLRVEQLVYVAALYLDPGETVSSLFAGIGRPPAIGDQTGCQAVPELDVAHQMFAGDVDLDVFAQSYERLVPEPNGLFLDTLSGRPRGTESVYLRCARDAILDEHLTASILANLDPDVVVEIDADHDVMLSHPAVLAAVLNGVPSRAPEPG
jgi:pimeloyl-ACP methyl ester carboxylesterase